MRRLLPPHLLSIAAWALAMSSVAEVPTPDLMQRLQNGEVLVENAAASGSGGSVRVQALLQVEVEALWNFIASCEHVFAYVDGMQDCRLLDVRKDGKIDVSRVWQVVDKGWLVPEMEYTLEVRRQPYSRVEFHLLDGNLENMRGYWTFEPMPADGGLLVTHEILVRPNFPAPRWLIRRNIRKGIPDMLACLRGLTAESDSALRADDLRRCPKNQAPPESSVD